MDNNLYLDLLKRTLSFAFWKQPPHPIDFFSRKDRLNKFVNFIQSILKRYDLELVKTTSPNDDTLDGKIWPMYGETMIGMKRLNNLQYAIETVIEKDIDGDFIETGVWRGGACIFMRAVLKVHNITDRRIFVADSFEGLPPPDEEKYEADRKDRHHLFSFLEVSQEEVENNFKKYGLLDDQVIFLKGWFKDTLPIAPIEKLAIMRLDGDMYESTMDGLLNLYHKLSVGGFCIIDDYNLHGCRKAVEDFRKKEEIDSELIDIDGSGAYWIKT